MPSLLLDPGEVERLALVLAEDASEGATVPALVKLLRTEVAWSLPSDGPLFALADVRCTRRAVAARARVIGAALRTEPFPFPQKKAKARPAPKAPAPTPWDCSCDADPGFGPHEPHCDLA